MPAPRLFGSGGRRRASRWRRKHHGCHAARSNASINQTTWQSQRSEFHPAHPERPVGVVQRWWVEGNRLCTTKDGCNAVLADERFLHVIKGEPPRFLMTFAAAPPGG